MDPNYPDNNQIPPNNNKGKSISSGGKKEPMKVKYISNPIMVQANNESEFRAVVQELTGKNSPGTHPGPTAPAATRPPAGQGAQGGGGSSSYSSGFHQNMMWKDFWECVCFCFPFFSLKKCVYVLVD